MPLPTEAMMTRVITLSSNEVSGLDQAFLGKECLITLRGTVEGIYLDKERPGGTIATLEIVSGNIKPALSGDSSGNKNPGVVELKSSSHNPGTIREGARKAATTSY